MMKTDLFLKVMLYLSLSLVLLHGVDGYRVDLSKAEDVVHHNHRQDAGARDDKEHLMKDPGMMKMVKEIYKETDHQGHKSQDLHHDHGRINPKLMGGISSYGIGQDFNPDVELEAAIDSLETLMKEEIFQEIEPSSHHSHESGLEKDNEDHLGHHSSSSDRHARSIDDDQVDQDLEEAMESFESLMKAASDVSHHNHRQTRSTFAEEEEEYLLRELREVYSHLNRASVEILADKVKAHKSLLKAKHKLSIITKVIHSREINEIINKLGSVGKTKAKRSVDNLNEDGISTAKMVSRGLSSKEYEWLDHEFHLSKKEVDEVRNLSEEEFRQFTKRLRRQAEGDHESEHGYTTDDLLEVFQSARQLVPAELEAAASGFVQVGKHVGGRVRVAVDPVVTLVRDTVIPETGRYVGQAGDYVQDNVGQDVKDWVGEGGRIAAKRVDAVVGYVGPRLSELSQTINQVQEQLTESAGDAFDKVAPTIIPALQRVVQELRETLETASNALPPVADRAQTLYNSVYDTVNDQVIPAVDPYVDRLGKTLQEDVGPTLKDAFKTSLNAVFTGVPKVISQLSHEAHDAAKVFSGNYKNVLKTIKNSNSQSKKPGQDL